MSNKYKSINTYLLKSLKSSRSAKIKSAWSRITGTGFIAADIQSIEKLDDHALAIKTPAFVLKCLTEELNLRETEECIKFLERQQVLNMLNSSED